MLRKSGSSQFSIIVHQQWCNWTQAFQLSYVSTLLIKTLIPAINSNFYSKLTNFKQTTIQIFAGIFTVLNFHQTRVIWVKLPLPIQLRFSKKARSVYLLLFRHLIRWCWGCFVFIIKISLQTNMQANLHSLKELIISGSAKQEENESENFGLGWILTELIKTHIKYTNLFFSSWLIILFRIQINKQKNRNLTTWNLMAFPHLRTILRRQISWRKPSVNHQTIAIWKNFSKIKPSKCCGKTTFLRVWRWKRR